MLALEEKQHLIQAISRLVSEEIVRAIKPMQEKIERLEKFVSDLPVPIAGKDGKDGKDADPHVLLEVCSMIEANTALLNTLPDNVKDWTREYVKGALSALPSIQEVAEKCVDARLALWPQPQDGKDGRDGVDGANGLDGQPGAAGERGADGAPGEAGKDGKDGRDGVDGQSLQLDDVRDHLADLVREAVADLPIPRHCANGFIDRDGYLSVTFSDGTISNLGHVVGKDGKDCDMEVVARLVEHHIAQIEKPKDGKDGVDGFSLDNFYASIDGRTLTLRFEDAAHSKEAQVDLPFPLYLELWKEGTYRRGDWVTRDGSIFACVAEQTDKMPGTLNCGWRLAIKRGRDGKDGKEGKQGPEGKAGRDGRDLTSRGPDGSKW